MTANQNTMEKVSSASLNNNSTDGRLLVESRRRPSEVRQTLLANNQVITNIKTPHC